MAAASAADSVQGGHRPDGRRHRPLRRLRLLDRGRDDAGAERLREDERVARPGADVPPDAPGMDQPHDGVAELGLGVVDGVAADDAHARLARLLGAAPQGLAEHGHGELVPREPDDRQHGDRTPAHRVDVGERVGGGDLPEGVRVVHDGREEVHRQHEREPVGQSIDRGVVAGLRSHQHVGVGDLRQHPQHLGQILWPELAGSAGAVRERRQANGRVHPRITSPRETGPRRSWDAARRRDDAGL